MHSNSYTVTGKRSNSSFLNQTTENFNFNYNYKYKNKEIEIKIKMHRRSTITVDLHLHDVPSQFLAYVSRRAFREPIPQHLDHQEATGSRFPGRSVNRAASNSFRAFSLSMSRHRKPRESVHVKNREALRMSL